MRSDVGRVGGQAVADVDHGVKIALLMQRQRLANARQEIEMLAQDAAAQRAGHQDPVARPGAASKQTWLKTTENAVVSVALFAMVLIPLAESFFRRAFHTGIPASTTIVQHMVLVVGMLGGAIAAREGRLLSLSTLGETALHGRWKSVARIFTSAVAAAISAFLSVASYQFVATEREAGTILGYGIPIWVVEWVLPLGFAVIAIRILHHASEKWVPRIVAGVGAALLVGIVMMWPGGLHHFVPIAMCILFVASVLGMPAFATLVLPVTCATPCRSTPSLALIASPDRAPTEAPAAIVTLFVLPPSI